MPHQKTKIEPSNVGKVPTSHLHPFIDKSDEKGAFFIQESPSRLEKTSAFPPVSYKPHYFINTAPNIQLTENPGRQEMIEVGQSAKEKARERVEGKEEAVKKRVRSTWALELNPSDYEKIKKVISLLKTKKATYNQGIQKHNDLQKEINKIEDCVDCARLVIQQKSEQNRTYPFVISKLIKAKSISKSLATEIKSLKEYNIMSFEGMVPYFEGLSNIIHTKIKSIYEQKKETGGGVFLERSTMNFIKEDLKMIFEGSDKFKGLDAIKEEFNNIQLSHLPDDVNTLTLLLKYFLALNIPEYRKEIPLEEAKTLIGKLDEWEMRKIFKRVFGDLHSEEVGALKDLFFIQGLIFYIKRQIQSRMLMEKTTKEQPGMIPSLDYVKQYFSSLESEKNEEVIKAFRHYVGGFYQHSGEPISEDIKIESTKDVFLQPAGIAGTRLLICAHFATLGLELMTLAGAQSESQNAIIARVIISDEELDKGEKGENMEYESSHAIANLRRKGDSLIVSNDDIYTTVESAFESVGISENDRNLFTASGPTVKATLETLGEVITEFLKRRMQENEN